MKQVVLTFPDNTRMAEFILVNKIGKVVVNSYLHTVNGPVSDEMVVLAITRYGAELSKMSPYPLD